MRITDHIWAGFPIAAVFLLVALYQGGSAWSFYGRAVEVQAEIVDFGRT